MGLDGPTCLNRQDPAACAGMVVGGAGTLAGLGGLGVEAYGVYVGGMSESAEAWDTALQLHGLLYGGIATTLDALDASQGEGCGP